MKKRGERTTNLNPINQLIAHGPVDGLSGILYGLGSAFSLREGRGEGACWD